ncbi:MAG: Gfo/Idh/MocA family oxidoreductase [Bryobacteraceae bacterium]
MRSSLRPLRIAMIGQGFMGRAHSNAFHQVSHFFDLPFRLERKLLCGRNERELAATADTWGWAETSLDWESAVERPDIDVVDIAAPNDMHAPIAIRAAEAGKMVWCEKPLSLDAREGLRMADAARGVPNMVWYNYRRVPALAYAKQLVSEGRLGRVYHYRAAHLQQWGADTSRAGAWRFQPGVAGSGVSADLLSHVIDTALWINGPIREVCAERVTFVPERAVDDACILLARFENGSVGTLEASRFAVGCRNRSTVETHGSQGMLRFDLDAINDLEFLDATEPPEIQGLRRISVTGPNHPYADRFWRPGHALGFEHTFIAALADFLGALATGRDFHPNFDDALVVQQILDAAIRSAETGSWRAVSASGAAQ